MSRIDDLEKELAITNQLLEDRDRVLGIIPLCPTHGFCLPWFSEWINRAKRILNERAEEDMKSMHLSPWKKYEITFGTEYPNRGKKWLFMQPIEASSPDSARSAAQRMTDTYFPNGRGVFEIKAVP